MQVPRAPAGGESTELCQFCIRRARRTCYRCNVGLCRAHAKGGYRFSLYVTAALCRPCADQWSDSPESGDDDESTSTEEQRADNEGQKRFTLTVRHKEEASATGAEEPHPRASSSTDAADAQIGGRTSGAMNGQEGEDAASPLQGHSPQEAPCVADSLLLGLLSDDRYDDEEAPVPSAPHWSRWSRCQRCWHWELDLERCLLCRRWVCPWRCWPGVGTRCWDCIPNQSRSVPSRQSE